MWLPVVTLAFCQNVCSAGDGTQGFLHAECLLLPCPKLRPQVPSLSCLLLDCAVTLSC